MRRLALILAMALATYGVSSAEAAELSATYTGQFIHLDLEGTFAQYTVLRAPQGTEDFDILEFNETGCTQRCTYEDFAIYHGGAYDYAIHVLMPNGDIRTFGPTSITISPELGLDLSSRATPNPARPRTRISWVVPATVAQTGTVRTAVTIHDPTGRQVSVLYDSVVPVGEYSVAWDGTDAAGRELPSGSYFYRIQAGFHSEVGRMALVK